MSLWNPGFERSYYGGVYLDHGRDEHRMWRIGRLTIRLHVRARELREDHPRVWLRSGFGNQFQCYCPVGFAISFGWYRRLGWLDFDWVTRPCPCDVAFAEAFSDDEVTSDQEEAL